MLSYRACDTSHDDLDTHEDQLGVPEHLEADVTHGGGLSRGGHRQLSSAGNVNNL